MNEKSYDLQFFIYNLTEALFGGIIKIPGVLECLSETRTVVDPSV